jgi:hypothetical protein
MMRRRPLTPEQLASIKQAVERGERRLAEFARGEGTAPGFEQPTTMPTDPTRADVGTRADASRRETCKYS